MSDREALLTEYRFLLREMQKMGLEPVIGYSVIDIFSDGELRALIKDSVLRVVRYRRMEMEQ